MTAKTKAPAERRRGSQEDAASVAASVADVSRLLVISKGELVVAAVQSLIEQLRIHKSAEFAGVVVSVVAAEPRAIAKELASSTFFCICDMAYVDAFLAARNTAKLTVPFCVVVPRYDLETLDVVFTKDPFVRGVIRESIGDPEDLGQLARLVKEERRNHASRRGEVPAKRLGWKIDAAGRPETGQLVSLFADGVMREFMQHLLYAVESVRRDLPESPLEVGEVWAAFRNLRYDREKKGDGDFAHALKQLERFRRGVSSRKGTAEAGVVSNPEAILIEGESGVGKTIIARWVARYLRRELIPVSTVNIGRELLEIDLFGTIPGGFTDAVGRPGHLLLAWGKVVLLDEIGDLPPEMQAKLLVYLDDYEFQPVGWGEPWKMWSPVYIIAATNRDLRREIDAGRFREDLYYRFRHRLRVPPLRERRGDLRPLIDLVLQHPGVNRHLAVSEISIAAIRRLEGYAFPGNVRELQSILSEAVFRARIAGRQKVLEEDLPV